MGGYRERVTVEDLRDVYVRRVRDLHRVAAAILGDRERARDVVHEAFVEAVRQRESFAGKGSLDGWVWQIVVNEARDARAGRDHFDLVAADERATELDGSEVREVVRGAVEQLPERQRLVLFLRYFADLDYATIASALGITTGTVAATLNSAHARMRELLAEVRQ
jgi:RNA polymerase sigma factor (sigma-70 family)